MAEPAHSAPRLQLAPPNLAGRRLGRYEVLCQLASGGMAAVYVARAQGVAGFERLVAIKVLHPHLAHEDEFISMFLDEARLAARIRHPNVVPTLDVSDSEGDGYFLVMDYIEGDHLGALMAGALKGLERMPIPVAMRIVYDALGGLGAAHDLTDENGNPLNLVHRDVSPHNVMVGTDGIARLTDFGVAKAEVRLSSTREGQFKGKLAYMAPEHASQGQTDRRSDVFAMGIILWECLTGRRLFRGENNAATLNKILIEPIPTLSSALPELAPLDALLARVLDREPERRFQTAAEFAEALEAAAPSMGGMATTRAVAEVVRKLAAIKLARDATRIKDAMNDLGKLEVSRPVAPMLREGGSEPSSPSRSHVPRERLVSPDALTLTAPGAIPSAGATARVQALALPLERRRRVPLSVVAIMVLGVLVIAGLVSWIATRPTATTTPVAQPGRVTPPTTATDPPATGTEPAANNPVTPTTPGAAPTGAQAATVGATGNVGSETTEVRPPASANPRSHKRRVRTGGGGNEPAGRAQPTGGAGGDEMITNPYRR